MSAVGCEAPPLGDIFLHIETFVCNMKQEVVEMWILFDREERLAWSINIMAENIIWFW
jgi:hypothetical protein